MAVPLGKSSSLFVVRHRDVVCDVPPEGVSPSGTPSLHMGMVMSLTMHGIPKHPHRKSSAQKSEVEGDVVEEQTLLTTHKLPPLTRGRLVAENQVFVAPEPTKIITISDLQRHGQRVCRMPIKSARPFPTGINPYRDCSVEPKRFADYVPDGVWEGRRCFIVGGGPSVKNVDMSLLAGELVIGINRAYELCDPSILFGVDGQLWGWAETGKLGEDSRNKFIGYKGYKAWMALHRLFPDDFYLINPDSAAGHKIGSTRKLSFKNNSGYGAINLAAALGAKEIYLLGFDMTGDKHGQQCWWHDGYPVDYGEGVYKRYIAEISGLAPVLQAAGIRVVNLNRKSHLRCFEFGSLNKVMGTKPNRPLVVSFYTKGTGYEDEAKRLYRDLHLFGLEYDIEGMDNLGDWQKNTHYKAKYIALMMDKHPNRNILWLDVDSAILCYPSVFDDAEFELGAHTIDWARHTDGRRKDHQLANAVIYLRNNELVRRFVKEWIELNEAHPERIEMQTMAQVLKKWKGKIDYYNLPAEYCQIFDSMGDVERPVIQQLQASRRLKGQVAVGYAKGGGGGVAATEKKKYDDCWSTGYKRSQCALPLVNHVLGIVQPGETVLDIGCGDGTTVDGLRAMGVKATGVDITLRGLAKPMPGMFEAPVWDLPFDDGQFDCTVSTDVLEHIPTDMIPAAIKEIYRVTKKRTFHVVALFDGIRNGVVLHMTVKPIEWWVRQFEQNKRDGVDTRVISRKEFMDAV